MSSVLEYPPILGEAFGVSSLLSPGAVLQRNRSICISGWGLENAPVEVSLGDTSVRTFVKGGVWNAHLPARKAGGPLTLDVVCGEQTARIEGIFVGEVILCAGQSNMEVPVSSLSTREEIVPHTDNSQVSIFVQDCQPVPAPARDVRNGRWIVATPGNAPEMPALPLLFGLRLQRELGIPVGVLTAAVGGSGITSWLPPSVFEKYEDLKTYWNGYPWQPENEEEVYAKWVSDREVHDAENARRAVAGETPLPWTKYLFFGPRGPRCRAQPSGFYHGGIDPLTRYPISGVVWYQGETDAEEPSQYPRHLQELIATWRAAWKQPELPIFLVQLVRCAADETTENWPVVREAQAGAVDQKNGVFLVPALDLGDPQDYHPADKDLLAARLARFVQLAITGAQVPQAPRIMRIERTHDESFRCIFSQPVRVVGSAVAGFELAGDDGVFRTAVARLTSPCTAVVESDGGDKDLRYLWQGDPGVNVFSEDGLPPLPFRTDAAGAPVRVEQHYLSAWQNGNS